MCIVYDMYRGPICVFITTNVRNTVASTCVALAPPEHELSQMFAVEGTPYWYHRLLSTPKNFAIKYTFVLVKSFKDSLTNPKVQEIIQLKEVYFRHTSVINNYSNK